jgi:4'-phosphopantetheinyl transferase
VSRARILVRTIARIMDLQIWRVALGQSDAWVQRTADRLLHAEERTRLERCAPDVRRRRLVAQIALRLVLADRLGRPPEALAFVRGTLGKPTLTGAEGLHFSLAHSGDCCLIAVTTLGPVGVDVEHVAPLPELDAIVASRYAPAEVAALERLSGRPRLVAFYRCWTRKEAYLKATGAGLSVPPATVEVWADDDRPVTVSGWSVHSLAVAPGFAAAVSGADRPDWSPSGPYKPSPEAFPRLR